MSDAAYKSRLSINEFNGFVGPNHRLTLFQATKKPISSQQ